MFLRVERTRLPYQEQFDQCRFCSVQTTVWPVQQILFCSDNNLTSAADSVLFRQQFDQCSRFCSVQTTVWPVQQILFCSDNNLTSSADSVLFRQQFDQCSRFCSVHTTCVQHSVNNCDEEWHKKTKWLRLLIFVTHPSSSPHYLSFFSVLSSCALSFYLTLFMISFSYPFPPLTFHYIHPVVHLFFLSSSYHPFSPCAHNHSSPPSSYFPTHTSVSYYHAPSRT